MTLRLLLACFSLSLSLAYSPGEAGTKKDVFPVGPELQRYVWFWEGIFDVHTSNDHVIHDVWHPEIVVDVLAMGKLAPELGPRERAAYVERYMAGYRTAIERLSQEGATAVKQGALERRLYEVYSQRKETLAHLLSGQASLRSQQGLADIFRAAAVRAATYLPYMERIFRDAKLPSELTRIVFVESMFRLDARSKVGASGIWQFMPATAQRYITVNQLVDERNSPLKATAAASRMLGEAYTRLGHWPLAITSYNHGVNGIQRAVKGLSSTDLATIIRRYRSPSFGFASRNFYAEFLAARNVYSRRFAVQRKAGANPLGIVSIALPRSMPLHELLSRTPLTESMLRQFNPCLRPHAFQAAHRKKPLPARYSLYVPAKLARKVESSLRRLAAAG